MKSLLLLLLIVGCGHKEPEEIDLQDDDGDLIANAYETIGNEQIAQISSIGEVRGNLIVRGSHDTVAIAQVSEWSPEASRALRTLKGDLRSASPVEYFRESHGLRLKFSIFPDEHSKGRYRRHKATFGRPAYYEHIPPDVYDSNGYTLSLSFTYMPVESFTIDLISDGVRTKFFESKNLKPIPITGKALRLLYTGDAYLEVTRSKAENALKETIQQKTRKTYVTRDGETSIFFLSKYWDLEYLRLKLGIKENFIEYLSEEVRLRHPEAIEYFSREGRGENYWAIIRSKVSAIQ